MIRLTRLNGQEFFLNAELIESLEATPDTVLTLTGGKTVMVRDSLRAVVRRILRYRRSISQPWQPRGAADGRSPSGGTGIGT